MITTTCKLITFGTLLPSLASIALRDSANGENGTCIEGLGARGFFILQVVASVGGTIFCLLAAIFGSPLTLFFEGWEEAREMLTGLGTVTCIHLSLIPTALIAAILPHSWNYFSPAEELYYLFERKSLVAELR